MAAGPTMAIMRTRVTAQVNKIAGYRAGECRTVEQAKARLAAVSGTTGVRPVTAARRVEFGEFTEEQLRVQRAGEALHRDGASPSGALELLAAIVEDRTWERVADKNGRSFKGRFREFVNDRTAGLGYDPDQLPKVLALQHPHESVPDVAYRMASMREKVVTLLLAEIPKTLPVGTPGLSAVDAGQDLNVRDTHIKAPAEQERRHQPSCGRPAKAR